MGYRDFRAYLDELRRRDLLWEVREPIDKDTELMPLVRWQFRGLPSERRRAFLFHQVTDARGRSFAAGVAVAALGASPAVYAAAFGCERVDDVAAAWARALNAPIPAVTVEPDQAPCKEVVVGGAQIVASGGLDAFPHPISTPGFDPAPYLTSPYWVSRDPETGAYNVGTYRGMIKAVDRCAVQCDTPSQHLAVHLRKALQLGRTLEVACVVGAAPAVGLASVSKLPYGLSEYDVAGGIQGEPIALVRCETVDLEVPATAEIVFEGTIDPGQMEPEGPFGETSGYMGPRGLTPWFELRCITHRVQPLYHAFVSEFPPSESTLIRKFGFGGVYTHFLRERCNLPSVRRVSFHESGSTNLVIVVQLDHPSPGQVWQALHGVMAFEPSMGKWVIAVDEDIDPEDWESISWALAYRTQPDRDLRVVPGRLPRLDPSAGELSSSVLVDATRPGPYPPTSLPAQPFMERAAGIWRSLGLPELQPRVPWHGYELGRWSSELAQDAALAAAGRYLETGERLAAQRRRVEDV